MNKSYESIQKHIQQLWQDLLSDEEDNSHDDELFDDNHSTDEYQPSASESDDDEENVQPRKRKKLVCKTGRPRSNMIGNTLMDISNNQNLPIPSTSSVSNLENVSSIPSENNTSVGVGTTVLNQLTDSVSETIEGVIAEAINSISEADAEVEITWGQVTGDNLKHFPFIEQMPGLSESIIDNFLGKTPYEVYRIFLNDAVLQLIVDETNKYADQEIRKGISPGARLNNWKQTDTEEIKKFFGMLMWMGLCRYPYIQSYWSSKNIYSNEMKNVLPRNRFQLILKHLHFSNNEQVDNNDRLWKITPLLELVKESYKNTIVPGETVCIDETLVPFRGRLKFRQYIPNKKQKFGIKLFKICVQGGYTYDFRVYCGNDKGATSVATKVTMALMNDLLDKGRTLCTDNWYTSVALAHELLQRNTHLVGTLKRNRKNNPASVTGKQLQKGETSAAESNTGVVVLKWHDRRDVLMLTTKHTDDMVEVQRRNTSIQKPKCVLEYNKAKTFIDISDQIKSYCTSLRRGVKWYRKLAIELLIGTSTVNALYVYNKLTNENMQITAFKEKIIEELTGINVSTSPLPKPSADKIHRLVDVGRQGRRRCHICYEQISKIDGRQVAMRKTPQSKYKCVACEKHFCLDCFFEVHEYCL
jgi:hypothetical protein